MSMGISALIGLALTGLMVPRVAGFTFNTSVPTQCEEFTVQWDGGSPPFHLVIVPAETIDAGRILNISIPDNVSPPYSHTFYLNEPAGLEFLATMYDAEGWGTGGTTPVLTVGSSDNSSCLSTNLEYGFYFYTEPTTPSQCQPMTITWPNNVTLPVSLYGMIPGGTAFELPAPQSLSDPSYDWTVNVAQGTDVLLLMSDASSAQTGGSTPLLEVGQGNTGCMNDTSPSAAGGGSGSGTATSPGPSASVSGVGGTSGGGGSGQGNTGEGDNGGTGGGGGSDTPIGAIVGGTLGGVAFILLIGLLLFFCLRRRSRERRGSSDSSLLKNYGMSQPVDGEEKRGRFDILAGAGGKRRAQDGGGLGRSGSDAETRVAGEEYQPSPFRYPSPPPGSESASRGNQALPPSSFPAGVMAGAGAGAGVGAATKESESRPSYDSDHSTTTGTGNNLTTTNGLSSGAYSNSQTGRTDNATVGHGHGHRHGHGVQRGASTRKTMVPPNPGVNAPRRGVEEGGADVGVPVDDTARFVQHQDEGPVVDLPPRYDQLRTRNPDV